MERGVDDCEGGVLDTDEQMSAAGLGATLRPRLGRFEEEDDEDML